MRCGWVRGLTLLELLVVLALLAVLVGLAVPALGGLWQARQVQAAGEALVADLRRARSEAMQRATTVAVCSSTDGQSCSLDAAWREGWIVFVDRDANRRRDAGEELLRVQERLPGLASVAGSTPSTDKAIFSFQPSGWAKAASQTLLFKPESGSAALRVLCISSQGRPTLRPVGQTACS